MTPLRQRMLEDMSIRNLTDNTKLSYVQQVGLYAKYFHRSPDLLGPQEVREYQVYLTITRKLSVSSISTATSALRFLYRVTLKQHWSPDDIPMPKKPFKLTTGHAPTTDTWGSDDFCSCCTQCVGGRRHRIVQRGRPRLPFGIAQWRS